MNFLIAKAILTTEQMQAVAKHMTNLATEMDRQVTLGFLDLKIHIGPEQAQDIDDLYNDLIQDDTDETTTNEQ